MRRAPLSAVLVIVAALALPHHTAAQSQPDPFPWEREAARALQEPGADAPDAPAAIPPEFRHLDRSGDGAITREEYFSARGRVRATLPGDRGSALMQRHRQRLESEFRSMDRDGTGRITPENFQQGPIGPRF